MVLEGLIILEDREHPVKDLLGVTSLEMDLTNITCMERQVGEELVVMGLEI